MKWKKLKEASSKVTEMLGLSDKDFEAAMITMLKQAFMNPFKSKKKKKKENLSRETEKLNGNLQLNIYIVLSSFSLIFFLCLLHYFSYYVAKNK